MYDELVKRLREIHPEEFSDAWDFAFACQQAMHEAADAIEELQEDNAALNDTVSNLIGQIAELSKTKWIPVTERLPEPNAVDEYGFAKGYLVKTDRHVMIHTARYTGEWWILWGYHKVITDNVTHWMRLPEPPKGET